ncbi:MAG: DUF1015 family protein [Bdellovibrionia bacterium]
MALIQPFRALRPAQEKAAKISSVPYDVVNREEAHALASGNPLSFLHVSRSEIDLPKEIDSYSDSVYKKAESNFRNLISEGSLIQDEEPRLYIYRLRMQDRTQVGVAGCFSLDEYDSGVIRKHERTRKEKEDDRTRHILQLSAQTGPVFLTYRNHPAIETEMNQALSNPPLYDFTTPDGILHTIWEIIDPSQLISLFSNHVPRLYIADGHHRAAAASQTRIALKEKDRNPSSNSKADFFLAVAFPDYQLKIFSYHRLIRSLGLFTSDQFLEKLAKNFILQQTPEGKNPATGDIGMYFENHWYCLKRKAGFGRPSDLDVSLLQEDVLEPILGITDPRTDQRIDFVGGIRGTDELENRVKSGEAKVAFALCPTRLDQVMKIADENKIMPPKSTWFEPKLRDGLLIHCLDR